MAHSLIDPLLLAAHARAPRRPGRFVWPGFVLGTAAAIALGFAAGLGFATAALVSVGLILVLLATERWMPADRSHQFGRDPQRWNDVGHAILGSVTGEVVGNLVLVAGAVALSMSLPATFQLWPVAWPWWAQAALLLVVADLLEYARHRALHRVPLLWRFHALHHDADVMHVVKSSRNHGVDLLFRFAVVYAPLALLGAPAMLLPFYSMAIMLFGPVSHANLDLPVPRAMHRLVVTPQVHTIHHARAREQADSNFGPVFTIWDQLFGTFTAPKEGERVREFGIEGERWPDGFLAQLAAPFRGPARD